VDVFGEMAGGDGAKEFQLANDKVSGQQQSLSHKKKVSYGASTGRALSHFLGISAFFCLVFSSSQLPDCIHLRKI